MAAQRYIKCEDIALVHAMRVPGPHPGAPSGQAAWVQSNHSAQYPLSIVIDLDTKMVRVAYADIDKPGSWGEFFTPLSNVKDYRTWIGPPKKVPASADSGTANEKT